MADFIPELKFNSPLCPSPVSVLVDGASLKTRPRINFVSGTNLKITSSDNTSDYWTNITLSEKAPGYYGSFYDTNTQTASSTTESYSMTLNTVSGAQGVTIVDNSKIKVANAGTYNIQFSSQFANSDSQSQRVNVFLSKNGTTIPWTNSRLSIPSSHGGIDGNLIAAWNFVETLAANDYIEFKWQTDSTSVTMPYFSAGSVYPSTPSLILTINQIANWS